MAEYERRMGEIIEGISHHEHNKHHNKDQYRKPKGLIDKKCRYHIEEHKYEKEHYEQYEIEGEHVLEHGEIMGVVRGEFPYVPKYYEVEEGIDHQYDDKIQDREQKKAKDKQCICLEPAHKARVLRDEVVYQKIQDIEYCKECCIKQEYVQKQSWVLPDSH